MSKKIKKDEVIIKRPILKISFKILILLAFISVGVFYSDYNDFFLPNNKNNHSLKKWESYYQFTKKNDIDILLFGNSHLYTGINPKNLSSALGVNSFILASPGTSIIDAYFSIKEAIKVAKPKLIIVETYPISEFDPYNGSNEYVATQLTSFSARKNFPTKLLSTPFLFSPQNYFTAWSNTIRNHDFLYKDKEQIKKNIKARKKRKKKSDKLYLGRYARFQTGIEDSILARYENELPPTNGIDFNTNFYCEYYVNKIIEICEESNIELIFLTLPMYDKSIANYPIWKEKISKLLGKYPKENWIDMQDSAEYIGFTPASFENRFQNQHMTYSGSLLATYKLVDFISEHKSIKLTNRNNNNDWINLFYGDEGYFENNLPISGDKKNIVLYQPTKNELIKEVLLLKKDKTNILLAKVIPTTKELNINLRLNKIRLNVLMKNENGQLQNIYVDLPFDKYHSSSKRLNYSQTIKPIDIIKINNIQFLNN